MSVIARRTLKRGAQASGKLGLAHANFTHYTTFGTVTVDPPLIGAGATGTVTLTIKGVLVDAIIQMEPPSTLESGLSFAGARITARDTVVVRIANVTAAGINGTARSWKYMLSRAR